MNPILQFNRTKIIATLGPASDSAEMVRELIKAGVDVFRLNFSHGSHQEHALRIKTIIEANTELGTNAGILADLQGPKIRIGREVENGEVMLTTGSIVTLTTKESVTTANSIYVTYAPLAIDVKVGDIILIDDGKIEVKVLETNGIDQINVEVLYGGPILPQKGVNLPQTNVSTPALTPKDIQDVEFITQHPVNWIALSFVRTADEIMHLKGMLQFKQHSAKIIAKIEKPEAITNIDEIIKVSDAIMVARGDLGVEVPLENVPLYQKQIVHKCNRAAKPVIIATQIMESMMTNPSPTRAEITDVANAIYEGADALMLSGETAKGKHPLRVIQTFEKIIQLIETQDLIYNKHEYLNKTSPTFISDTLCLNACQVADTIGAKAIIGMTKSGYTAFMLSSFRPRAAIFIFTESQELLNQVSLVWGVRAFPYHKFNNTEETMRDVKMLLKTYNLVQTNDIVINIGTMPLHERGTANTLKISRIS